MDNDALKAAVLGLVRPVQVDNAAIVGVLSDDDIVPHVLEEGQSVRFMAMRDRFPGQLTVTGKLWAKNFRRTVTTNPLFSRATAAWVFSHGQSDGLSFREQMRLAMMGRAVSPVTSYLAIEPVVRPSQFGLVREDPSLAGYGRGSGNCIVEGVWALELPDGFTDKRYKFDIAYGL